ncbi:MAG: hypothetical protein Q6L68_10090, partial [Thermostichus sp. DG02_5_bins_236]
ENQPIGQVLKKAGLLNEGQIQVALMDQRCSGLLFGEVLVARGWIKPETITFFLNHLILPRTSEGQSPNTTPPVTPPVDFQPYPSPEDPAKPLTSATEPPTPPDEDFSRYITRSERIPSVPIRTKAPSAQRPTPPPAAIPPHADRRTRSGLNPFRRTDPPTQFPSPTLFKSKSKETFFSGLKVDGYSIQEEWDTAREHLLDELLEDSDLRELLE